VGRFYLETVLTAIGNLASNEERKRIDAWAGLAYDALGGILHQ
jgi:hypothetical protein